jgi:branched-chain amino acid transport system substrate-binding protein
MFGQWIPTAKDPLVTKFVGDFQKQYKEMPVVFAAQGYDAMLIVLAGLAKNGPDREKLQQYVSTVRDFPGVTGKSTFKNGDVDKKLFRFTIVNGKFTQVQK